MTAAFLLTSFVIVATPGTGALFTIAAGVSRGARASIVAAAACTLGIVPHLAAAITGTAALLQASGVAFEIFRVVGVAYLLGGSPHALTRLLGLSAVFMAMTFVVFACYGVFAAAVRTRLLERPLIVQRVRRVFALSFVALGARLATTERA